MVFWTLFLKGGGEQCAYTWVTCSSCVALTCMVITTIWWRGALTCGSCVVINMHGNYYYILEGSPHIHVTHVQLMCSINVHGNYYYMVEGNPHMWQLMCTVITTKWLRGALMCGSRVVINMHSNYYMVEGNPSRVARAADMWQLMCTVITIWWTGGLMCGMNVHGNYYYMVEGTLTCGN